MGKYYSAHDIKDRRYMFKHSLVSVADSWFWSQAAPKIFVVQYFAARTKKNILHYVFALSQFWIPCMPDVLKVMFTQGTGHF